MEEVENNDKFQADEVWVAGSIELYVRSQEHAVPNCDWAHIQKNAANVHADVVTQSDIVSVVAVKW